MLRKSWLVVEFAAFGRGHSHPHLHISLFSEQQDAGAYWMSTPESHAFLSRIHGAWGSPGDRSAATMAASTPFLEASSGGAECIKSESPRAALPMSSGTCSPARAVRSLSRNPARRCSRGPHGGGVEPSSAPHPGSAGRARAPKGGLLLPTLLPGHFTAPRPREPRA